MAVRVQPATRTGLVLTGFLYLSQRIHVVLLSDLRKEVVSLFERTNRLIKTNKPKHEEIDSDSTYRIDI